ncbi:MAG: HAD family phosphatase, partial [Lautropia sp.]|nr:HAD family phosphatase [Lautropia sp.]
NPNPNPTVPVLPLGFMPAAVIFDMDGLLLDSERVMAACLEESAVVMGLSVPRSLWLQMVGKARADCRRMLADHLEDEVCADALLAASQQRYEARARAGIPHRPGVGALLAWLASRGMPRAVATTTRQPLASQKLQAAGLLTYFATVVSSTDVALPKPAPDVYLLAASRLGVAPARCLVLEDSATGVRAALAAGMTPVQVPDLVEPDDAVRALGHRIVASLHEAQALLAASPGASA